MVRKRAFKQWLAQWARRRWPNLDVHDVKQRSFAAARSVAAVVLVVTGERGFMAARIRANSREVATRADARAGAKARSTDRSLGLAEVLRAISVPPACRRRGWPAAGYSGRIDPGRVGSNDEDNSAARTTRPPPSRRDDQALEALSAVYVPRWRIGFLVPPAEHSADRAALISEFAGKIKVKERGVSSSRCSMKFIDQQNCWRTGRKWTLIAEARPKRKYLFA